MNVALECTKDPSAVLDYGIDWTTWLGTDAISSSTWTVPSGITQNSATNDAKTTTIWLAGGTSGATYEVTNRIVTTGGRTDERTIRINVADR